VNFTSPGAGDPDGTANYEWDFGDGSPTSSAQNPTHTYTAQGTYTATLTVTDDNGASASSSVVIEVGPPNQVPVAVVTAMPESGKTPLLVSFDATGSSDPDGSISSYEWDFGDGGAATGATPTHTYTAAGTYEATVTVTDNQDATDSASVTITVVDNVAPTAEAAVDPTSGKSLFTSFSFSSAGSADSDGTITGYHWDFDDGTFSTSPNPSHIYNVAGEYAVTLTVTDDSGDTDTATVEVSVADNVAPTAVAGVTPSNGKTNITSFAFSSAGSEDPDGTIASYSWNFGDGGPASSNPNPTKVFGSAGVYEVVLTVTDDNGATATNAVTVTVADNIAPTVNPTVNAISGTTATNFNFTANAADPDGTVTAYLWTFGDGTFATTANPVNKKYNAPGTYNVTVRATDNNGAQTTSAPITITIT
jgi:PKD repeat protein